MNRARLAFATMAVGIAMIAAIAQNATAQPANLDWTISDAQSAQSATVHEFSMKTGKFHWHNASDEQTIIQVKALVESVSGTIGPIQFSEIKLKSDSAGGSPASPELALMTAGTWDRGCAYLDGRDIPDNGQAAVSLRSGDQFRLINTGGQKLQFLVNARRMFICFAFAAPKSISGDWILRAGKFEIPIAQGMQAIALPPLQSQGKSVKVAATESASGLLDTGAALAPRGWSIAGATASIMSVALVLYYRRRKLSPQGSGEPKFRSSDAVKNQVVPHLTEAEIPIAFNTPEDHPGPGAALLAAASRAMQAEDLTTAGECARQSLDLGLAPGHIGKAQLFLAEAAIARGDLLEAIDAYRQCLHGNNAVLRSVLPAAANLALIYSKLGMRDSARLAEHIMAGAQNTGVALHPTRVQLISKLTTALNRSMRADRWRALIPGVWRIFRPAQPDSAKAK